MSDTLLTVDEIVDEYVGVLRQSLSTQEQRNEAKAHLERLMAAERKKTASAIFNLAHEFANKDKTMNGSEELRNYHYYDAIAQIGEFDGR